MPRAAASGTRGSAASAVRPNTTAAGEKSSTATLMNRYGTPQMTAMVAKSSRPRAVTRAPREGVHRPAGAACGRLDGKALPGPVLEAADHLLHVRVAGAHQRQRRLRAAVTA